MSPRSKPFGSATSAVRIQVNPLALASRGIGIDEIANAARTWNVNMPTAVLYGRSCTYTIETTGQLTRAEAL